MDFSILLRSSSSSTLNVSLSWEERISRAVFRISRIKSSQQGRTVLSWVCSTLITIVSTSRSVLSEELEFFVKRINIDLLVMGRVPCTVSWVPCRVIRTIRCSNFTNHLFWFLTEGIKRLTLLWVSLKTMSIRVVLDFLNQFSNAGTLQVLHNGMWLILEFWSPCLPQFFHEMFHCRCWASLISRCTSKLLVVRFSCIVSLLHSDFSRQTCRDIRLPWSIWRTEFGLMIYVRRR